MRNENKYYEILESDFYFIMAHLTSLSEDDESKEDFFSKMVNVKEFIRSFGYSAELIYFNADKICPYDEATINIDFYGGE